jgi:hypothetical protein
MPFMRKPIAALTFIVLALIAAASSGAETRLRAGNYETTSMFGESTTAVKGTHCFTAAEAGPINGDAATLRASAEKAAADKHFTVKDYKLQGDTQSYTLVGAGTSTTTTTTYHGDSYEFVMSSANDPGSTVHMKGRRIGDCP